MPDLKTTVLELKLNFGSFERTAKVVKGAKDKEAVITFTSVDGIIMVSESEFRAVQQLIDIARDTKG